MSDTTAPPACILVVDDERGVFDGVRRRLRRSRPEWTLEYAEDVPAALTRLAERGVDLILSDYAMPGATGFDLIESITGSDGRPDPPVVLLTGSSDVDLKRKALDLGATDLLSKPIDPWELEARLGNALRAKEWSDQLQEREAALESAVRVRTAALEASHLESIFRLAMLAEYRDESTGRHVVRVGSYARLIAESMGLGAAQQRDLLLTAPLHDIGKVAIPDAILLKPGGLTEAEWKIMRSHCRSGHEILSGQGAMEATMRSAFASRLDLPADGSQNHILSLAAEIALTHHERWDGAGYPDGLAEYEIPLVGRITAVADVFDALTSARTYKEAMSAHEAIGLMHMDRGTHFDPAVFDAFAGCIDDAISIQRELGDTPDLRAAA